MSNSVVTTRYGKMIINDFDIVVGLSLKEYKEYFESEVDIFRQYIKPGSVCADIGANMGAHTVAMANIVGATGTVISLEPQRIMHQILCANVAINSLYNVYTFQLGAGSERAAITSTELDYTKANNFGGFELHNTEKGSAVVQIVSLDSLFENIPISFIKIDIEGMEIEALKGCKQTIAKCRPVLYCENDRVEKSEALVSYIKEMDYRVWWHIAPFFNPDNFAENTNKIHTEGFFKVKDRYVINGYAINILCLPKELDIAVQLPEVIENAEHPCLFKYMERLAPNVKIHG